MTNTDLVKRLLDEDVLPYLSPEQVIDLCSDAASAIIGLGSANKALTALIAAAPDIARAYLTAKEGWDGATKVGIEYQETIARLTAERDRLRDALRKYGRHVERCGVVGECVCGLDAALGKEG